MKSNIFKSFRFEIVIYSLLSMLYTLLTITVLMVGVAIVYFSLGGTIPKHTIYESQPVYQNNQITLNNQIVSNNQSALEHQAIKEKTQNDSTNFIDNRMILIVIIVLAILAVILFILYFLKLTKKFSVYMSAMGKGIDEISKGNFSHTITLNAQDEFGDMCEKINHMSKDIENSMKYNQHSEDRKHELITSVAHDLRTPLTSVIGYLELLKSDQVDEATRTHYVNIVYNKSKRLEQLIEDLFSYTKYTYGNVADISEPVDIVKLLEQLMEEFYPSFTDNHLTYEFFKDCNSMISYADGNLLARALANLISNAIKYGAEGKRIEIFFSHTGNSMKIAVKNYGTIIPNEDLPHIFERFYRVESSRSCETGGSGLGLAIARSIVQMHHGEISAKSDLSGTTFEMILPVIREPESK